MWSSHSKFSWLKIYFGLCWKFGWYSSQVRWRFCIYLYRQCWFFCVSNSWYVDILISFFFTISVFYFVKYTLGMITRFCLNSNCRWKVGMIVILRVILIFVWLRQVDWLTMGMIIFATDFLHILRQKQVVNRSASMIFIVVNLLYYATTAYQWRYQQV